MRLYLIPLLFSAFFAIGCAPKHHTATTTIEFVKLEQPATGNGSVESIDTREEVLTEIAILQSHKLAAKVAEQLEKEGLSEDFVIPYKKSPANSVPTYLLLNHRSVEQGPYNTRVALSYAHPDPEMAVKVADLFAEAYIQYHLELIIGQHMHGVEQLRLQAENQSVLVQSIEKQINQVIADNGGQTPNKSQVDALTDEALRLKASRLYVQHTSLLRELEAQQAILAAIEERLSTFSKQSGLAPAKVRVLQSATVEWN